MRVCIISLDFIPFRSSGLAIYAERLALGLARRGHQVQVITAQRSTHYVTERNIRLPQGIEVIQLPIWRTNWIGFGWQAARLLSMRSTNYDIVHFIDVHFAYAYKGKFIASAFQSFRQRRISNHGHPYHSTWLNYVFRLLYYFLAQQTLEIGAIRKAQHIIMASRTTQNEFVRHYHVPLYKSSVVYFGIDIQRFEREQSYQASQLRHCLNIPQGAPVILYVGFSTPRKGVEYLAQAMAQLDVIQPYLVMVGRWESRAYQQRFLSRLGRAKDRVRIVGYVPDEALSVYFKSSDLFVLPSLLEGFGITLIEAMASGLPIVTTTGGAAGEIVGNAGIVVPTQDSVALAQAIKAILTKQSLSRQLIKNGKKRVRTLFTEEHFLNTIEKVYLRFK